MMRFREIMDVVGTAVDTAGVSVIVIGALIATTRFLFQRRRRAVELLDVMFDLSATTAMPTGKDNR